MSRYPTNDYNLRFFFMMATGPNHTEFKGSTKITEREKFYLSKEIVDTKVETINNTDISFIRNFDERQSIKVFYDEKLNGVNVTWLGLIYSDKVNSTMFNGWDLNPQEYLKFLVHDNNVIIFESKNAGHENMTIGYMYYSSVATVSLEKEI